MTDFTLTGKWVYVVTQNDFASAVFSSNTAARAFCDRAPKRDINGRPIYWRFNKFQIDDGLQQSGCSPWP